MVQRGYLGIDIGTQGLSVVFANNEMKILGTAEGHYEMIGGLPVGCFEQQPQHWMDALVSAVTSLKSSLGDLDVQAIGISGQMHGEVLIDADDQPLKAARLWCDARNEAEGMELTASLGVKMPKRITAARWLWTIRNFPDIAAKVERITTPGGWVAFNLTGQWNLGIGDASGMFPIDQATLDYDVSLIDKFDSIAGSAAKSLRALLPRVVLAGGDAGSLTEAMAQRLGLQAGIPVAPAEGDQPASLAGSLIGQAGMVSCSFGTSVCANSVGDRRFTGVSDLIDHFCAVDGKPINMVFLRNGTTYMNSMVEMFGQMFDSDADRDSAFQKIMPLVTTAATDCGGVAALPFMDDEPGLGVSKSGQAGIWGLNAANASPANIVKAALLATMFNLKLGSQQLDRQGYPRREIVLSGGLTKTPELGQILADVFDTPVKLLAGADEGCAWGAALLAKYRSSALARADEPPQRWDQFLQEHDTGEVTSFSPNRAAAASYNEGFKKHLALFERMISENSH